MPSPFGQSADYSGVFSSLGREQIAQIASATRSAVNTAQADQNAADQDTYSKWKAGQLSDEEWLAYIRQRLAGVGGDPVEQQKWADMLRTNEAAISDSQAETNFRLGKISSQALLSHYRERMGGVEQNSPAYRDIAERYQQLVDYTKGRSGGGGGSGGESGASLASYIASQQGNKQPTGYAAAGDNVIPPASDYYGIGTVANYLKTLEADRDRIRDLVDQYKADPTLTFLTDHMTGQQIPVGPDMLHALDNQYLRNQDSIATVYDAKHDPLKATAARTDKGSYISSYMADHNTDRIEPAYDALQKTIVAAWKTASDLPPAERMTVYQQTAKMVKDFEDGAFPGEAGIGVRAFLGDQFTKAQESSDTVDAKTAGGKVVRHTAELPAELKASGAFLNVLKGWDALHQAITNPNLSDEERQLLADEAVQNIPGNIDPTAKVATRGERNRLTAQDVKDLLYGDPNIKSRSVSAQSQLGEGFSGGFAALEQGQGLDNRDPSYDGQRFVYNVAPDGSTHVVPAKSWPNANGTISLTPLDTVDRASLIQTVFKVGGSTHVGFSTAQTIPANLLPKEALVYRTTNALTFDPNSSIGRKYGSIAAGGLIPSDVIKALGGMGWVNSQVRSGAAAADSPFRGVVIRGADGPIIWYQDPKTGLMSTTVDLSVVENDPITGGIKVSVGSTGIAAADINDVPFAKGSPIAFGEGISRKEMIAVTRQQIESGQLDPSQFSVRGEGTSVRGQATADDLIRGFGPPTISEIAEARAEQHDAAGRGHAAKQFDKIASDDGKLWMQSLTSTRAREGTPQTGPIQDVVDSISQFTSQMGVQIKPNEPLPGMERQQQQFKQQDFGALARNDALEAMKARQAAMQSRMPKGLQPKFAPPTVNFAPLPTRDEPKPVLGPVAVVPPVKKPTPSSRKFGRNLESSY